MSWGPPGSPVQILGPEQLAWGLVRVFGGGRPKGLARSLHLLRPPGAWFLIRGPRFSSPGPLAQPPPPLL
ncbi:hypothetical protein JOQ06_025660 [Pogonophryne albipinna]|uniref:Uncharacterized protein n=1 Tax=Pogonophryne albipinna TaxID=1090488 RepID=A0AAD6ASV8_9TELE|nr:hypothetical protein JOQ06_025660 [Pogonophryne albipinna]